MKASGRPIIAAFKRAYSAQAQAARSTAGGALPKQEPKVTKLGNGAIVASLENYAPVSRIAVLYNAGSRFEPAGQQGITHALRSAVNLSTEKSTNFIITRQLQQLGAALSCTTTREHMIYSLECLRGDTDVAAKLLGHAASQPAFRPWELKEAQGRTRLDLAMLQTNPEAMLMEALHTAAYRDGLGNSLYSPDHKVGYHNSDMLHSFVSKFYTSGNVAVVGLGVPHDALLIYAKDIVVRNSPAPAPVPSPYVGDQVRIDTNSPLVHAAVVTEGVGMGSKDLLTLCVLQKVMGTGPYVKYGSNMSTSKVSQAAAQGTNSPFAASCINALYSDTGLFGFQVVAQAADMDKVIKSLTAAFGEATKGGINEADVQRAKNQVKTAFSMGMENSGDFLIDFGVQASLSGQVLSADDVAPLIDNVTLADVQNVAKKVINGKPSMAAVGDLSSTPYLDQIF